MSRLRGCRKLQLLLLSLVQAEIAFASPDLRLISLVTPESQLVAGVSASSRLDQPNNFLLLTHDNQMDLVDFYALVGSDSRRRIHQMVFVKLGDLNHNEHSMLVSGHFNQQRLLQSAAKVGGKARIYHGTEVAEIQPLDREKGKFDELRWLAIPSPDVLFFGSVASVQMEIDRYLAHSLPDEKLIRRLGRLSSKDQTWCVLSTSVGNLAPPHYQEEIHQVLAYISPNLADKAISAEEFEFGLFYGRKVEFEYFLSDGSIGKDDSGIQSPQHPGRASVRPAALLPPVNTSGHETPVHGVIAIPVPRFEAWLAEISIPH